jgi:hypothetical protein
MAVIYEQLDDRRLGRLLHRRRFTPEERMSVHRVEQDVTETLPDGRTIQVAAAGTELPLEEAKRLGLVKEPEPQGPAETKKK